MSTAFGSAVRRLRNKKSISINKLAVLAGMQTTYLGDIERGNRNPALANMLKIAKALDVPLSKLIQEMENEAA
jgi:transcriptional regulator with XRE-family HTH domain